LWVIQAQRQAIRNHLRALRVTLAMATIFIKKPAGDISKENFTFFIFELVKAATATAIAQ
jgi:hypothetical protein